VDFVIEVLGADRFLVDGEACPLAELESRICAEAAEGAVLAVVSTRPGLPLDHASKPLELCERHGIRTARVTVSPSSE
jgi:hypothetical protein